jgi:HK97 family phage portal protein
MATLFGWTISRNSVQPAVRAASQLLILRGDGTLSAIKSDTPSSSDSPTPAVRIEIPGDDIGLAFAVQASAWAYRCIMIRAQAVSRIKRRVVNIQTGKEIPDHPMMLAIREAFRFAQSDLLFDWEMALCIWGEAYLEKIRNVFSMATGVRWLNPAAIEPYIYDGRIAWYDYSDNTSGRIQRFKPNDIIYHKYRNPLDDFRGLAPMTVALDAVNVDRDIQRATRAWYRNDSRPDGIVTPKGIPLNDKQYNALLAKIQEQLKGAKNRGRTFVSDQPVEWLAIQREPVPEQPELEQSQRRKIAAAIGVPLSLAGAWDDATYQSLPEQRRSLYYETIFPECDLFAEMINTSLMPFFDMSGQTRFEFDFTDVKVSIEDVTQKSSVISARVQAGVMTINGARAAFNEPPLPGGDVLLIPSGFTAVPVDQLANIQALMQQAKPQPVAPFTATITPSTPSDAAPDKPKQLTPSTELAAWERAALNSGRNKALRFVCYNTPSVLADHIRSEIAAAKTLDKDVIKDIFARATERLADVPRLVDEAEAIKDYDATRAEFISNLTDLIRGGLNEEVSRRRFGTVMRAQLRRLGQMAFQDGLQKGGVNDPLDEDDLFQVQSWLMKQSEYISSFANEVFKQGLSELEIESRAQAWANKSLEQMYQAGLLSADKNGLYVWKLGRTEEHCGDCKRLNGQVHRLKQWYARGWVPKSDRLECQGFNCDCGFERVTEPARGRF